MFAIAADDPHGTIMNTVRPASRPDVQSRRQFLGYAHKQVDFAGDRTVGSQRHPEAGAMISRCTSCFYDTSVTTRRQYNYL
jgi:hypothetical protein